MHVVPDFFKKRFDHIGHIIVVSEQVTNSSYFSLSIKEKATERITLQSETFVIQQIFFEIFEYNIFCLFVCPSVCPSVCSLLRYCLNVFFSPTSRSCMCNFFRSSESLGENNGKKWSQI